MILNKILIVDDDKSFNFLSKLILNKHDIKCHIEECINGEMAVDYISKTETCPDVILLDLNMPILDGFQFLEAYKNKGKCCGYTKIFILTSSEREEDRQKVVGYPFVKGFFDKPLTSQHISKILAELSDN